MVKIPPLKFIWKDFKNRDYIYKQINHTKNILKFKNCTAPT